MPYPNEHAARLRDPNDFAPDTFRRVADGTLFGRVKVPDTIEVIWGKVKGADKPSDYPIAQALRFPTKNWTEEAARAWLKDNGVKAIDFEPASNKSEGQEPPVDLKGTLECDLVCMAGPLEIEAANSEAEGPRVPRFSLRAYTGRAMDVGWGHPIVVNIAGISLASAQLPVRLNHDPDRTVGHLSSVQVRDGELYAYGMLSFAGEPDADRIVRAAANGFAWQASIGANVAQKELIAKGQNVRVNDRDFSGPIYVIHRAVLGEVSFVDQGADSHTSVKVAANASAAKEIQTMPKDDEQVIRDTDSLVAKSVETKVDDKGSGLLEPDAETIIALAQAKRKKQRQMAVILQRESDEPGADLDALERLYARAVEDDWSLVDFELAVLRANRPSGRSIRGRQKERSAIADSSVLEAAALMSSGFDGEKLVRSYGEPVIDAAAKQFQGGIGLKELVVRCAQANGHTGRLDVTSSNWREMVEYAIPPKGSRVQDLRASGGFSTVDLTGILGNVANKALAAVAGEPEWLTPLICGTVSHSNFHQHTVYSLAMNGELYPVGPTGELKHVAFGEESYTRQVTTRGAVLRLSRTDVVNDDLGAFARNAQGLARKAFTTREKVLFTAICATGAGSSFFTAAHGNYLTGATTAFSPAGMANAIQAFRGLTGPDGDPIGVEPRILLVPPTLEDEAARLLAAGSNLIVTGYTGTSARTMTSGANIYAGRFGGRPLVSAWLENAALTGHSTAYWYLLADPRVYPAFEIAYLNGAQTPTVEYFGLESDADTLGMTWRIYWDFGVGTAEWRAGVKSAGA